MREALEAAVAEHAVLTGRLREELLPAVERAADRICESLGNGGTLFAFGNGGSAADAQHLAAELVGRFRRERAPLAGMALTTDSSALTAIGNDYDFRDVFARQVRGVVRPGDVVVAISTSGTAENVVAGLSAAAERGATTIVLTGSAGGKLAGMAAESIVIPSDVTARVQEMHVLVIHLLCELIDAWAAAQPPRTAR